MRCDRTPTTRIVDLSKTGHPDTVKMELLKYIRGLLGRPRRLPITRTKILRWFAGTPAEAIDGGLKALVDEKKIIPSRTRCERYQIARDALPEIWR
jgi:hypothetical protein